MNNHSLFQLIYLEIHGRGKFFFCNFRLFLDSFDNILFFLVTIVSYHPICLLVVEMDKNQCVRYREGRVGSILDYIYCHVDPPWLW